MFCAKCGMPLDSNAVFCPRCGNKNNSPANQYVPKYLSQEKTPPSEDLVQENAYKRDLRSCHITSIVGAIVTLIAILWYFVFGVYLGILISILAALIAFTPIAVLNNSIKKYEYKRIRNEQQINTNYVTGVYRKHIRKKMSSQYKGYRTAPFVAGFAMIEAVVFVIMLL